MPSSYRGSLAIQPKKTMTQKVKIKETKSSRKKMKKKKKKIQTSMP